MRVRLYKTNKRLKSTLKLELDEELNPPVHVFENAHLKEQTDIDFPTFELGGQYYDANYIYVDDWERFYFIRKYKLGTAKVYEVQCEVDGLASLKEEILNSRQFVLYSSSNYNRWIRDDRVPLILHGAEYVHSASAITVGGLPLFEASDNETVLITTVSKGAGTSDDPTAVTQGGLVTWITTEEGVKDIINSLTNSDSIWASLTNQFGDAMGSIVQIMRLPIRPQCLPTDGVYYQFYLGNSPVTGGAPEPIAFQRINKTHLEATGSCGIPATYLDFRRAEPYVNCRVQLPFVGVVDVSLSDFPSGFEWRLDIDLMTGSITWTLYQPDSNESEAIASFSGQIGSLIPIASQQIANASNIVYGVGASALQFGIGALTGNPAMATGGAVGSIASVANAFYASAQKSSSIVGSYSGNRSEFVTNLIRVVCEKFQTANEPDNLKDLEGRPLMKVVSLEELTGYCRTVNASLQISATAELTRHLEQLLDSGIYIE